jgi:peptidoglycan-associated lipoprotein
MKKLAILIATLMFVACASPKPTSTQATQPDNNSTSKTAVAATSSAPVTESTTSASSIAQNDAAATAKLTAEIQKIHPEADAASTANLAAEIQKLHNESVYFDFDEYVVKPEFRDILEKQASNFKSHKNVVVVLDGNADERGSAAYNLALGEKRSTSVKKALVALGVPSSKIKVVSYGNTKPILDCHEEKCWQENRRVDFVYEQK